MNESEDKHFALLLKVANKWRNDNGMKPVALLAAQYELSLTELTNCIQRLIAREAEVEIPNVTPKVEVAFSAREIDEMSPRYPYVFSSKMLEYFYYSRYPNKIEFHEF